MWQKIRSPLLFLSLGMNIAFLVVLGVFWFPGIPGDLKHERHDRDKNHKQWKDRGEKDPGWWFYKKKIGVSDTQWRNLRPPMEEFHGHAYKICKQIQRLRNEILKQIESTAPDQEIIREKEERILELKREKQRKFAEYMIDKKRYLSREQQQKFYGKLRKHKNCDKHARFLENQDRHS